MPVSPPPTKEGELKKYRSLLTGWGKRYFRLERSYLHYFETKHTHAPLATITRGEITYVRPSNQFPDKQNVFEIAQKSGVVWYCQAKSAVEMTEWMQALSPIPIVMDPSQYPTVPMEHPALVTPPTNPQFEEQGVYQGPHSPYMSLIQDAHATAAESGSQHLPGQPNSQSPPPPYSAHGYR